MQGKILLLFAYRVRNVLRHCFSPVLFQSKWGNLFRGISELPSIWHLTINLWRELIRQNDAICKILVKGEEKLIWFCLSYRMRRHRRALTYWTINWLGSFKLYEAIIIVSPMGVHLLYDEFQGLDFKAWFSKWGGLFENVFLKVKVFSYERGFSICEMLVKGWYNRFRNSKGSGVFMRSDLIVRRSFHCDV